MATPAAQDKKKNVNGETETLRIDSGLHRQFKIECAKAGVTMRDQVETLIRQWNEKGARA